MYILLLRDEYGREALAGFNEEVKMLFEMRYLQIYEYDNIFGKHTTWSPFLTGSEWKELDSQVVQFYKDNKGKRDLRFKSVSAFNNFVSLGALATTKAYAAGTNKVNNIQPSTTDQPRHTNQESVPLDQEASDRF